MITKEKAIEISQQINPKNISNKYYTSEYLYRISSIYDIYQEVLKKYLKVVEKQKPETLDQISLLLNNHVSNKIKSDNTGQIFIKLPDSTKYTGDYDSFVAIKEQADVYKRFILSIIEEFKLVIDGDWTEEGKTFIHDQIETVKAEDNNYIPQEEFIVQQLNTPSSQIQDSLVFFNLNNTTPQRFYNALTHIYKCLGDNAFIKFELVEPNKWKYRLSTQNGEVTRIIDQQNNTLCLIDFTINPLLEFSEYEKLSKHESSYFSKFGVTSLSVDIQMIDLLKYYMLEFYPVEVNKIIEQYCYWLNDSCGLELKNKTYEECVGLCYDDPEKDNQQTWYFNEYLNSYLDPTKTITVIKQIKK